MLRFKFFFPLATALLAVSVSGGVSAQTEANSGAPNFQFDGSWPQLPLPNKWEFEGITGLIVDPNDVIWVLQRPSDYDEDPIFGGPNLRTNYASLDPPSAMCCLKPDAVLAFSQDGELLRDIGDPGGGFVVIYARQQAGNAEVKYSQAVTQ